ncbi:MAG: toxin-antitoxin system HicB family antitoxin [Patescibacteria group bacterium]|jgi:predicted HicB family RNase H-like nuclease
MKKNDFGASRENPADKFFSKQKIEENLQSTPVISAKPEEKLFKTFLLRLPLDLHQKIKIQATINELSIHDYMLKVMRSIVGEKG